MKNNSYKPDWTEHELIIRTYKCLETDAVITEHILKKPNTMLEMVTFCNHNGICSVTGDYSNWIFDRMFVPKSGDTVNDVYWIENLKSSSCQKFDFDLAANQKAYAEEKEDMIRDYPTLFDESSDEYDESLMVFYDGIQNCETEDEYWFVINDFHISEPFNYKKTPVHLKIIFEAYEEICRRLTNN